MSFYTCFDWFKKLRLFSNVRNLKIDVVLKASRAVVIRWFSLNEAPLGLFRFISDYLPYFEKINIFFNIITKKSLNSFIRIDRNYLFGSFKITSIRLYTPLRNPLHGVYNLIEVISSWAEQKLQSILNCIYSRGESIFEKIFNLRNTNWYTGKVLFPLQSFHFYFVLPLRENFSRSCNDLPGF
jgi:hypothetical protein